MQAITSRVSCSVLHLLDTGSNVMVALSKLKDLYPDNWQEIARHYKKKKKYTCEECGKRYPKNSKWLHVHHRIPLSKGGDCEDDNLQLLCFQCHRKKHSHMGGSGTAKKTRYSKPFN